MSNHAVLDPAVHRDLRVHAEAGVELGDGVMACITVPTEFRRVQNEFPILFRRDLESGNFSALALMGFENGENLFLEERGWDAAYRPMALAIQPFLVGRSESGEGPAQVHIDLAHPRIAGAGEGMSLFDETGRPTPYLENIAAMLEELDTGYRGSPDFFKALERHELIEVPPECSVSPGKPRSTLRSAPIMTPVPLPVPARAGSQARQNPRPRRAKPWCS